MGQELNNWAIIRRSGQAHTLATSLDGKDIWYCLETLHREHSVGGSNYDAAKTLYHNGKEVPLPEGKTLSNFYFAYVDARRKAIDAAIEKVKEQFTLEIP